MAERKNMILITIRLPEIIVEEIDRLAEKGLVASRSEFIRNAILNTLVQFKERDILRKLAEGK